MTFVIRGETEPFDGFMRRWKTTMEKSGIVREFKRRQRFTPASELRRLKAKAAERRRAGRTRHRT